MSTSMQQSFGCPACGRKFTWQARHAGKNVTCACGRQFVVPQRALPIADPYDVSHQIASPPTSPSRAMPNPPPSVMRPVPIVNKQKSIDYDPTEDESTFKGVILPAILIGIGLILRIVLAASAHTSAAENLGLVICQLVLSLMVMLIACTTAAMMMSLNFGSIQRAALKLCAVSLFAGAIGTAVAATGPRNNIAPNMSFVAWYVVVFFYLILFLIFFSSSVGIQESLLTVVIVIAMQLAVSFALGSGLGIGQPLALFFTR